MKYEKLTADNIDLVVDGYVNYYNNSEGEHWTSEKAGKRIMQIVTMMDSECLLQRINGIISGFVMGHFEEMDTRRIYFLDEIVVYKEFQNKGCGSALLMEIEKIAKENGADRIELITSSSEHHLHYFNKLGFDYAKGVDLLRKSI